MNDEDYMAIALQLAKKGRGFTSPNPMVGAIIVKNGKIIGEGYHEKYGEFHAERSALNACTENPNGATMYVTLEPCCHYGKQPPCVDAIIKSGIRRVVIGSNDPNPLVSGKGMELLRKNRVIVTEHILQEECDQLNEVFFHYVQTKRPFVVLKYAMTMDGKLATRTGESKWVTGEIARHHVMMQRHDYRAIMVGIGTVLADDPLLTCRMDGGRNPIRIICDTELRTPLTSKIVTTARDITTIIATCSQDQSRASLYEEKGCQVLLVQRKNGHIDLEHLMDLLGQKQIDSVLLEGGGTLNWSALSCGIVQKVQSYIAPKLFGGQLAKTPIEGLGVASVNAAFRLKNSRILQLCEDFLIESEVESNVYGNC